MFKWVSSDTPRTAPRWVQAALAVAPCVMWGDKTVDKMCHNNGAVTIETQIILSIDGSATKLFNSIVFLDAWCMLSFYLFNHQNYYNLYIDLRYWLRAKTKNIRKFPINFVFLSHICQTLVKNGGFVLTGKQTVLHFSSKIYSDANAS